MKGSPRQQNKNETIKLFVFGDSYADTGNSKPDAGSWKLPYGLTFPGKPSGRFSDGRILTDYIGTPSFSLLHSMCYHFRYYLYIYVYMNLRFKDAYIQSGFRI